MRSLIGSFVVATIAVSPLLSGTPALAQSHQSADDIIRSLIPAGNLMGAGTRGIKLHGPAPTEAASAPAPVQATVSPVVATRPAAQPAAAPNQVAMARPAAPATAASQPAGACSDASGPSKDLTINFATGSAELTPQAIHALDELGAALSSQQLSQYRFRVEGHTDTVGTPGYNKALSDQRARAAVAYVEHKFGVKPARLEPVGMGSECPKVPTPDQTANADNRRVTVINLGT